MTEKITTLSGETRLSERYTYRTVDGAPTTQVASHQIVTDVRDITYSYTYDDNGNILTVTETFTAPGALQSTSTTTSYVYDSQNQLLRENNEAAGKTWTWTYDNAGNILSHGEYAYTTVELGTALDTVEYGYTAAVWGDLLCTYDGAGLGCDDLGNLTIIGDRRYVWKHGRELSQLIEDGTTWTYTYNADGLRTKRTDGTTTYQYIYADGQLVKQKIGNSALNFSYDASGTPMSVTYNSANYYYVTNLQGDVIAITNDAGAAVVSYTYDAWGQILSITGSMADTLGAYNPLRYRGYVYDVETELYYLQSRYYDPEMGRFISPDAFASTGQGFSGNNMFAYCGNDPVNNIDATGHFWVSALVGAAVNVATSYIAAKVTGQDYTWQDAAVDVVCGVVNAIPGCGMWISGIISGVCSGISSYQNGANLGGAILSGAVSCATTLWSIGDLAAPGNTVADYCTSAFVDTVFGTGYSCVSTAVDIIVTNDATNRSMSAPFNQNTSPNKPLMDKIMHLNQVANTRIVDGHPISISHKSKYVDYHDDRLYCFVQF